MIRVLKINNTEYSFSNSVWTLKVYKDLFKSDWYADRNKQLSDSLMAAKFAQEYASLTDEQFNNLPKEKQDKYWYELENCHVDMDFTYNTIYAMAVSGGYKGTQQAFWENIPATELNEDSALMQLAAEFVADFSPNLKSTDKKKVNQ